MKKYLVATTLILLLGVGAWAQDDPRKRAMPEYDARVVETIKLQGTWQVVKFIREGEALPADAMKNMTFEFKDDALIIRDDKERKEKYVLYLAQNPQWIDIGRENEMNRGIYKFDGDELTICCGGFLAAGVVMPAPRPTEFKCTQREKSLLVVLKRVKKP